MTLHYAGVQVFRDQHRQARGYLDFGTVPQPLCPIPAKLMLPAVRETACGSVQQVERASAVQFACSSPQRPCLTIFDVCAAMSVAQLGLLAGEVAYRLVQLLQSTLQDFCRQ